MSIDWKAFPFVMVAIAVVTIFSFPPYGLPAVLGMMAALAFGYSQKYRGEGDWNKATKLLWVFGVLFVATSWTIIALVK